MEINYTNNKLSLIYKHNVRSHTHSTNKMGKNGITTTQYLIPLSTTLKQMTNIRQVIFIYNHNNQTYLTPQEPPNNIEYKTIRTYVNKQHKQTVIPLPTELLPQLTKQHKQTATIKYYPQEQDPHNPNQPLITLEIQDLPPNTEETTAQLINNNTLEWNIQQQIPEELQQLLTPQQKQTIQTQKQTKIHLDLQTSNITLEQ